MASSNNSRVAPGPYTVFVEMVTPMRASEMIEVNTLREASAALREWLSGGNPAGEPLGVSQTGRHCGRVTQSRSGEEVARVGYNGRVWEPGTWPTAEITNLEG